MNLTSLCVRAGEAVFSQTQTPTSFPHVCADSAGFRSNDTLDAFRQLVDAADKRLLSELHVCSSNGSFRFISTY